MTGLPTFTRAQAVSLDSHAVERALHLNAAKRKRAGWDIGSLTLPQLVAGGRIVDNYLIWSYLLCPCCLEKGTKASFPKDYSIDVETAGQEQRFCTAELCTRHGRMQLSPVSHNAGFAAFQCEHQSTCRLGTFFNHLLTPREHVKQFVTQFMARCNFITLRDSTLQTDALTDLWWELIRLGYPPKFLLKVLFSVPLRHVSPALRGFRYAVRRQLQNDPDSFRPDGSGARFSFL